jgi:hypothetical protein
MKDRSAQKIPVSDEYVESYLSQWKTLDKYVMQESCINLLFQNLCHRNSNLVEILLKVSALNDFYSTNIYDTHSVARHIHYLNIDASLKNGDLSLVDQMANVNFNGKTRRIYSFATKYCSHHAPDIYPIYDNYVDEMLWFFRKRDGFTKFTRPEMKDFLSFVQIIDKFRYFYDLTKFTRRQIDIFLWLAGKDHFPKSYAT